MCWCIRFINGEFTAIVRGHGSCRNGRHIDRDAGNWRPAGPSSLTLQWSETCQRETTDNEGGDSQKGAAGEGMLVRHFWNFYGTSGKCTKRFKSAATTTYELNSGT